MSLRRLAVRIESISLITSGFISNHLLKFNKPGKDGSAKCSIEYTNNPNHLTHGVVFKIDNQGKQTLDIIEGLGRGYAEKEIVVFDRTGLQYSAITYYATVFHENLLPYDWYHRHVMVGAEEANLPASYIQQISAVNTITDPNKSRHAMEIAIYE
jgi:hypothetical protein